jgi:hypothetical protein
MAHAAVELAAAALHEGFWPHLPHFYQASTVCKQL